MKYSTIHKQEKIVEKKKEIYDITYNSTEKEKFDLIIKEIRRKEEVKHKEIHTKKWNDLLMKNKKVYLPNKQTIPIVNLSDQIIDNQTEKLLEKGFKYRLNNDRIDIYDIIPKIENAISNIDETKKHEIRYKSKKIIEKAIKKPNKPKYNNKFENRQLKELKNNENIAIIRTDKTNKIAILNRIDYDQMLTDEINNMKCIEILKDPTKKIHNKVKELHKEASWLEGRPPPKIVETPNAPRLFGRLKDHKNETKIRPIVEKCIGPTYEIEKYMEKIYKEMLIEPNLTAKSTIEFIRKIKNITIGNECILASLDIKALYPSIKMTIVKQEIINRIDGMNLADETKRTLKIATNIIIDNNYFVHNKKFYKQEEGAPMGSPTSGSMAEFELRPLENKIITENKSVKEWIRYVDDIFLIWEGDETSLEGFVKKINRMKENIEFTYEIEKNNKLNYLDVEINRINNKLETRVYRKPFAEQIIIPNECQTYKPYKLAPFRFYIKRALDIGSNDEIIKEEINWIRKLAENAGYSSEIINKLYNEIKYKRENININKGKEKIKIKEILPYIPKITEKLKTILKKNEINIAIKQNPNIFQMIKKDRDKTNPLETSGIYKIPIKMENKETKFYIGETKRKINKRIQEHKSDLKFNRKTTAMANLALEKEIEPQFDETRKLSQYNNRNYAKIRETLEIIKEENSINDKETIHIDKFWKSLLHLNQTRMKNK